MKSREAYNSYRKAWWVQSLGSDLSESRIFLPRENYQRVVQLAETSEERIPVILGKLVVAQLEHLIEERTPVISSDPDPSSITSKAWWAIALGEDVAESRIFLPKEQHERIVLLATQLKERVPVVLGKLVISQLNPDVENQFKVSDDVSASEDNVPQTSDPMVDMNSLYQAILSSRFLDETGANRLRQVGFIVALSLEIASGKKPTASSIAASSGNHVSQIASLAKTMKERGVIYIRHAASVRNGRAAKIFSINPAAISSLNAAHQAQAGCQIPVDGQ